MMQPNQNELLVYVGTYTTGESEGIYVYRMNPHIFRHSIARYLKGIGLGGEWAQHFLGHSSIKTTMDTYGTISIDEMQEVAARELA